MQGSRGLFLAAALLTSVVANAAEVTVSAAASLRDAFLQLGQDFERANPDHKAVFNFGASGQLVQQIARGAPVDVLATADMETMDRAAEQSLIRRETRATFASNKLVVVSPADSVVQLASLADLARPEVRRVGLGSAQSVPAGRYAKLALERAGRWDLLADKYVFGQNVRQVLDYVARGEVDAGFVYLTDVATMKGAVRVALTADPGLPILYPIAVVKGGGNDSGGRGFVSFVRSSAGQAVLARHGFGKP
jgi:molybdate transport system substrate-binding protein